MGKASTDARRADTAASAHSLALAESSEATAFDTRAPAQSQTPIPQIETDHPPQYTRDHVSEAPEEDPQRFTAAGRPMVPHSRYDTRAISAGNTTENILPIRFKDSSFISIPITQTDIDTALAEGPSPTEPPSYGGSDTISSPPAALSSITSTTSTTDGSSNGKARKPSFSFLTTLSGSRSKEPKRQPFKTVKMTRGEYLTYFAKDEQGAYRCSEPRGSGAWKAVLRARLADADLQALGRDDTRFVNGVGISVMGSYMGSM